MSRSAKLLAQLGQLHPKKIDLSLGRIERLLGKLNDPHHNLPPTIHVAGTKGKGSTIAFFKAILEAAGKSVHLYTSPHLVRFHERIQLAGKEIEEEALIDVLTRCADANDGEEITFFEITNAAAFLAFHETPADYCLVEVGMGGRFDSTNVLTSPALSVITTIGLDHMEFLGDTIEKIAFEKAGILKPGVPAIVARQAEGVEQVIRAQADKVGTELVLSGQDFDAYLEHESLVYQDTNGLLDLPLPRLAGRYQLENAALAIRGVRHLNPNGLTDQNIATGVKTVHWPGRLQRLTKGPLVDIAPEGSDIWLDGAHNAMSAKALASAMGELEEKSPRPLYLVCGLLQTKEPDAFFEAFEGLVRRVFTVPIEDCDCYAPSELYDIAEASGINARPSADLHEAMDHISELAYAELDPHAAPRILICGSLYLAGQVLAENS